MTIGVGIVGLSARGGWAGPAHVPALAAMPDLFRLTGLSGSTPEAAAAAAARFEVPFHTTDAAELARRPDVDLVVISVKLPDHRELIERVSDAGKAIYCEWPLGCTLAEAEILEKLAADRGIAGFIGLQARSAPQIKAIARLIEEGFLGELRSSSVKAIVGAPWNGHSSQRYAYLNDRRNGATMLSIPFGHCFDAVCNVLGPPSDMRARLAVKHHQAVLEEGGTIPNDVDDHIGLLCTLGAGTFASFLYTADTLRQDGFHWELVGTEGRLSVIGYDGHLQYGHVRLLGAKHGDELAPIAVPDDLVRVPLPFDSHAFTVAHSYHAVADAMTGKSNTAPRFADAVQNHRFLADIAMSAAL